MSKKRALYKHQSEDNNQYKPRNNRQHKNQQQSHHQSPYITNNQISTSHNTHNNHQYYNNQPYYGHGSPVFPSLDEHKSMQHGQSPNHNHQNHQNHHNHHLSLLSLGRSTPNIHHTHTNRHMKKENNRHNRHSNPPKHHPHGLLTNTINSSSPQTQLKQLNLSKSDIFNNHPHSLQNKTHKNNNNNNNNNQYRQYVVNPLSPPLSKSDIFNNNTNNNYNNHGRNRARTYTQNTGQSPRYNTEESLLDYNTEYNTTHRSPHKPRNNVYSHHHQTPPQMSLNPQQQQQHIAQTYHQYSQTALPPQIIHTSQQVTFNSNFSALPSFHQSNALPSHSPNMAPNTVSLDQFYKPNNKNYYAHSQNKPQHRRYYSTPETPEASPDLPPDLRDLRDLQPIDSDNITLIDNININATHMKSNTNMSFYHIINGVDNTPSSESSNYPLDDDYNNLQEYQLQEMKENNNNNYRKKQRNSGKIKKNRRRIKKHKNKDRNDKKKKQKKRRAIWGNGNSNKYFLKKSSHKRLLKNGSFQYKKSESTKRFLKKRIQKELLFENLPASMIKKMVQKMYRVDIPPHKNVVCCGDAADAYFVIEKGKLEVLMYDNEEEDDMDSGEDDINEEKNKKLVVKDALNAGDTFGDNALLYATTHKYTYRGCDTPILMDNNNNNNYSGHIACRCWALSQETFDNIRKKQASTRLESSSKLIKFVKSIVMFKELLWEDLQEISDALMRIPYRKGDKIVCEGDSSTHFFIIYRGTCDAYKNVDKDNVLKSYSVGDCFGELGIMKNQARAASVRVTSDQLIAYALPALDFKSLLDYDPVLRSMNHKIDSYFSIPDDCKSFENRVACKLSDFKEIGCLGVGAFGRVTLVENNKQVYALKRVRKNRVVETSQQEHIINEKRIMAALNNTFCIKLFATFKDELNVYFLLEPVMGGELFSLLRHEKRLKQRTATFYCASVVLAFDYLHTKLNVIYRDLKPENLLISTNGYCKLVDFGFAKKRNNTCTLCGTPQYLAPEVIQNFSHGFAVDWWSVGILIYEMIFGYPPFEGDKNMKMYEKILTAPVEFPSIPNNIRSYTKDIINSLLRKQAHKRLGAGPKGAESVKKHSFFKRIDWNKMYKQEIEPPWKPRINGNHDLSAFDRFPDTTPENEKLIDDPDGLLFTWCDEF